MQTVTRILYADDPEPVHRMAKIAAFMRTDIWQRFGGLGTRGKSSRDLRKDIAQRKLYTDLPIDGTIRNETTKDIVEDIYAYRAAAMKKVHAAVFRRTDNVHEQKRLLKLLRTDDWLSDSFLHRQMRKHFRHGHSHDVQQFIVRSDKFFTEVVNGFLTVVIHITSQYGDAIRLTTTSNGKNVDLKGCNLRIIVQDGCTAIHYATSKGDGRPCGDQTVGVDKGYTEAFTDSDGDRYGQSFGRVMTQYTDQTARTMQGRHALHKLEQKHRKAGRIAKADRIRYWNLGSTKIDRRRQRTHQRLRNIAYQSVHKLVDKARFVISEDLTRPIRRKSVWKRFNRLASAWAKGILAEALDTVCDQRDAIHECVNAAYTSQMDSSTGRLEGRRDGDTFYRSNGDVMSADHNAAVNVLRRYTDTEITRYTPYRQVRRILLARHCGEPKHVSAEDPALLNVNRHELQGLYDLSTVCG